MPYKRSVQGGGSADLGLAVATSGGAVFNIKNWGVSMISVTSADVFTMLPPTAGCQKTLVFGASSSSVATVVNLSTAQTVSVLTSTGSQADPYTKIKKAVSASTNTPTVVCLTGLNTTSWVITSVFPGATTTPTAAIWGGAITLST